MDARMWSAGNYECVAGDSLMGKAKIKAKKVSYDGHEFDSTMEKDYYEYLKSLDTIKDIQLQPEYTLMQEFYVECGRCKEGIVLSSKTNRPIKCKTCRGTGMRKRKAWRYTADFKVAYQDGSTEVIDVKGFANERFPLVRKMYEYQYGEELIVIKKKKGEWVRA